jgi:hypothetical protein
LTFAAEKRPQVLIDGQIAIDVTEREPLKTRLAVSPEELGLKYEASPAAY